MDKEFLESIVTIQDYFEKDKYSKMLKDDEDYQRAKEELKKLYDELDEARAMKIDDTISKIYSTELDLYFREGFKSGIRFILNCMK